MAFPFGALLALAAVVFVGCLTETLPAGVLIKMSADLHVPVSQAGQSVTVYALATAMTSMPLTMLTRHVPRRALLLSLVVGFAVANATTAVSPAYGVVLVARLVAGAVAGVMWAMIPGYAMRMARGPSAGRALAVAMMGTPLGFAVGMPAGTALGDLVGWRWCFAVVAAVAAALLGWVLWRVPALPGGGVGRRPSVRTVFAVPGFAAVLMATLFFVLGHNVLYTYLGPVLAQADRAEPLGSVLLVFGVFSVLGVVVAGTTIDRWLWPLALVSTAAFGGAAMVIGSVVDRSPLLLVAAALWGTAFGGAPTVFPAATARIANEGSDIAQSLTIAVWNLAIAGGAFLGGFALELAGNAAVLPWLAVVLAAGALVVIVVSRRSGFPEEGGTDH
ncbi:MAG: MFS transporter [Kutzneria sp.]|nr:MFS transporter [Kutzneria sp.]